MKKEYLYASLARRFAAYVIDHLLTALLMTPLFLWYLKGLFSEASGIYLLAYSGPVLFLLMLIRSLYLSVLWSTRFGTIGCHLLSISVCTLQGNKLSYARAFLRYLMLFFSTCLLGLGWISILFTEKRQALCDLGDIKNKILQVLEQTGAQKVNIIAHSKGGLDARYAISMLGMAPYVASLTTMNAPHRGCKFVDRAIKLPDSVYRLVAGCFDRTFRRFGDKNPDFYTATHQFSTAESEAVNAVVHDAPEVYYQSYTSLMKGAFSDLLLSLPYLIIRRVDGPNDGLVTPQSAAWGNFRGIYQNQYRRGISHGDMIDLKRQDYRGFDVVDAYVAIVHELKERGF